MKKVDRFIVKALNSNEHVAFDNLKDAEVHSRRKLVRKWEQGLEYRGMGWERIISENYDSFQKAVSDDNVKAQIEDVSIYICSDGAEFEDENIANEYEFMNALIELSDKHGITPERAASLAEEVRPKY